MVRVWMQTMVATDQEYYLDDVSESEVESMTSGEYKFAHPCVKCGTLAYGMARLHPLVSPTQYDFKRGPYCPACICSVDRRVKVKIVPKPHFAFPMPPLVSEHIGVWPNFAAFLWVRRRTVSIRRGKRCRMYSWTNCHYIVTGGRVITRYGFNGEATFNRIESGEYGDDVVASMKAEWDATIVRLDREFEERRSTR